MPVGPFAEVDRVQVVAEDRPLVLGAADLGRDEQLVELAAHRAFLGEVHDLHVLLHHPANRTILLRHRSDGRAIRTAGRRTGTS
jgi:hypothetical protein